MNLGKPNLQVFADTVIEIARSDPDVLVITGDSRGSARLKEYAKLLPDQVVEVGIAEQALVGVSSGLAMAGKKPYAVAAGCFLTARGLEQIKNDVAYSNHPVKLIAISAGVSYGNLGSTHHSIHDLAVLQAINNVDIVVPADNLETRGAILAAYHHPRPIYVRMGKFATYDLHPSSTRFEVGKAIVVKRGRDLTFVATGETVSRAVHASQRLAEEDGLSCGVISMHTLRPFDEEAVLSAASDSRALITVEEHSVYGGLGSRCASLLMQNGVSRPFRIVGIPDEYTVTGSQDQILRHYGISGDGLADLAKRVLIKEQVS